MKEQKQISDEILNSLIDDQLTTEEKEQLYLLINQDPALNRRVCELRNIQELTRLAYKSIPQPATVYSGLTNRHRSRGLAAGLAAGLVLAIGITVGWQLGPEPTHKGAPSANITDRAGSVVTAQQATAATVDEPMKVLFHLNSDDPENMREALNEVENVLKFYRRTGQNAKVELIANGGGLNLLRVDTSPYPERIQALQREYSNLVFVACQNTIDRLKREHGVIARLVPGAVVIDSGVAQIMRRQQQGWAYIQV